MAATTVNTQEINVKPYSFPVRLITLHPNVNDQDLIRTRSTAYQPANTLPVEMATCRIGQLKRMTSDLLITKHTECGNKCSPAKGNVNMGQVGHSVHAPASVDEFNLTAEKYYTNKIYV